MEGTVQNINWKNWKENITRSLAVDDNTKMEVEWIKLAHNRDHGNEPLDSMKDGEFLDYLSD
jgi:hypothetical protein